MNEVGDEEVRDTRHTSPSDMKEGDFTFIPVCFDGDAKYYR